MGGRHLVVFALATGGEESRLGVTATRRLGGAVVRNRARRRLRELFRRHADLLAGFALDVVVNARGGCAAAAWGELEQEWLRCVTKVRRLVEGRAS